MEKERREKEWRKQRGDDDEDDESGSEESSGDDERGATASRSAKKGASKRDESSASSSEEDSEEESSDDEKEKKAKGTEGLIAIENPNRVQQKQKKVSQLNLDDKKGAPQLSRREREQIEQQKAKAHYQKLHAQGKTEEARADLARLAIIRKEREEAAKKREADKKG